MSYTEAQLTVSRTAEREGLSNAPATSIHRRNLNRLRTFLKSIPFDFRINSAYRSPAVNEAVGGSQSSQHMNALALDLTPNGLDNKDLATWFWIHRDQYPELDQVIWYSDTSHVHIGICPKGAEDCHSKAPRAHFYSARNEAGSYSSWEPTLEEVEEIDAAFPQGRKRTWTPLLYAAVLGLAGVLFFQVRDRKKRTQRSYRDI